MSNRPKGFKRMPIFYIDEFESTNSNLRIKSTNERLSNDEYYYRLVKQVKKLSKYGFRHVGSKGLKYLLDKIRNYS